MLSDRLRQFIGKIEYHIHFLVQHQYFTADFFLLRFLLNQQIDQGTNNGHFIVALHPANDFILQFYRELNDNI